VAEYHPELGQSREKSKYQQKLERDAARWRFMQKKGFCWAKDPTNYKFRVFLKRGNGVPASHSFLAEASTLGRAIDKAIKVYKSK